MMHGDKLFTTGKAKTLTEERLEIPRALLVDRLEIPRAFLSDLPSNSAQCNCQACGTCNGLPHQASLNCKTSRQRGIKRVRERASMCVKPKRI